MSSSSYNICTDYVQMASQGSWCFFFNDTATTEIYTLSLHDALPIFETRSASTANVVYRALQQFVKWLVDEEEIDRSPMERMKRSEEHTSELQSRQYLVCRLLLEKKKNSHGDA